MGRQIQLHMLGEDLRTVLGCLQKHGPVVVTLKSSNSPNVEPVDPITEPEVMTVWNPAILGSLQRKLVKRAVGKDYYRVDDSLPTLELSPSRLIDWQGKSALLQGRIYGFFDKSKPDYESWYDTVIRCIRANFRKSPFKILGGYIGPDAMEWFENGGVLLPMFVPPASSEWISFVENQHRATSAPMRK